MTVTPGSKVYGSEYNTVATLVNKVFGDNYPTATPLTSAEASSTTPAFNTAQYATISRGTDINGASAIYGNYRFGWGAVNIANNVALGDLITADRLQYLVDRVNIMVDHVNITDTILVFAVPTGRTTVDKFALIRAEDLNIVENKINNSIVPNYIYNTVDPSDASLLIADQDPLNEMARTTPWTNKITGEYKWAFDDYAHARHFFNSGGQLRIQLEMSGGCTAGYYNWSDVINEMGVLTFTVDNLYQSNNHYTAGTSYGRGFYQLTENYGDGSDTSTNEGLLFESAGVTVNLSGYGYGYGSAYSSGYYGFVSNPMTGYTTGYHFCPPSAYSAYATSVYASAYGSYSSYASLRFKIYGKWANSGTELHFKVVLDDTAYDQTIDGQIEASFTYLMPDVITRTSWAGSATFDVTPDPYVEVIDNFNTVDDS
jgi:hypothetical protein